MQLYPLHKELLDEAITLLFEKHKADAVMTAEVAGLHDELRFEGILDARDAG